jgi:pimeloyl-ACP methyl ester carboxylesterase
MSTATRHETGLAYELEGAGAPVVFLHGLTFDRRTWRPILACLGGSVRGIAIDLPAHGESGGAPAPLDEVATRVHRLLASLSVERPIMVGHSMMGGLAAVYAAAYPTCGVVMVDSGPHIRPFAELAHRLEPALRGAGFAQAWQTFEDSLGLERIPEPVRSLVLETHRVEQAVVLGYWEPLLSIAPAGFQAWIDARIRRLAVPLLGIFGRPITEGERERFEWLPDVQLEEWPGDGHFVHLVDPARFAARLDRFVDHCGSAPRAAAER